MNVADSYGLAGSYGSYGTEKTPPASSKPFKMSDILDEKSTQKGKDGAVSTKISSTVEGVLTFHKSGCKYDPFKDIAKTGSVNFPDFIQTKTTPTRSDEEILKELEKLAKEHAITGQYKDDDERYLKLMDEYISSVSPDRAGILKEAAMEIYERLNLQGNSNYSMSAAFQQIDQQRTKKEEKDEKEPIDYFLEALKNRGKPKGSSGATSTITRNGNYHTETIDYGGGKKTYLNYANGEFTSMQIEGKNYFVGGIDTNGTVRAAEFYDDNGNRIMSYNGNDDGFGLHGPWTKEEGDRFQELSAVYSAAYDVASGKHSNSPFGNKEVYNSTYERLTSSSIAY
jgi:hypothetical protein